MKKTQGLSPNQERIMSILEYKKIEIITKKELLTLIEKYMKVKDSIDLIEKLLKKRKLVSIKRGVYMIMPFTAINKTWSLDEYKVIDYLLKDNYYIGLYNAFNQHGFTEQVPNKLFVFNTKYSFDKKILYHKTKLFKIKKDKLFGILNKYKYPYSDRERTIIDVLDYPEYLGGLSKIIPKLKNYNKEKLVDYAIKYNSVKIMKIVGYLTNSSRIYRTLKNNGKLDYYTTVKKTRMDVIDKKWKIRMI
jgi:predicted transcriptional regulator of viral defense system